jgi:crossover junction endodeoxyribonuclease RusA
VIRIDVLGSPATKGNARAFVNKKTGRAILSSFGSGPREKKLRSWDAAVREAAAEQALADRDGNMAYRGIGLAVALVFRLRRPNNHYGTGKNATTLKPSADPSPIGKPDVDKLARSTLDPLHDVVFDDDCRIVELMVRKEWARPGLEGATIVIDEWRATS